jgi:hypothetical protein
MATTAPPEPTVIPPVDPKPFWESRTVWLNVIGVLLLILASPEIVSVLPGEARPYIAAALAVLNILNRTISATSPLTLTPVPAERKAELAQARRLAATEGHPSDGTSEPEGPLDPFSPNDP